MKKILAIIPARSGSKSVKNKNIKVIDGKPMIAYSIRHALESTYINRVIVSTDSEEYAKIAREYGAETPFIRPAEYATDTALDIDVFSHALGYLREEESYEPDVVVQLRPTYPIRHVPDIDAMIACMLADDTIDSVRSVSPAKEVAHKMWYMAEDQQMTPILTDIQEAYNMPRQQLPRILYQNANIDVIRPRVILEEHSMSGRKIMGYEMKDNFDIDTEEDFARAAEYLRISRGGKRFVFDIDGVIALKREDLDYAKSDPNEKMIRIINRLYDMGNEIILFTARGYVSGVDWSETTRKQMESWHVKYHELHFGKPNADYYVDDKMLDMQFLYDEFSNNC
ncbi:MAG: acylneuraminate cytidylyltransferase family protein [Lachnospiraceae bacterium]|nr:acylneuraminate cytidylyltransferase family protein [Lachnospiraceae bacterium]